MRIWVAVTCDTAITLWLQYIPLDGADNVPPRQEQEGPWNSQQSSCSYGIASYKAAKPCEWFICHMTIT